MTDLGLRFIGKTHFQRTTGKQLTINGRFWQQLELLVADEGCLL